MSTMSSNPRHPVQPLQPTQPDRPAARWLPGLVDLLARRPDLAGIGYTHIAQEVGY